MDDGGDDIRTARTSVAVEHYAQADTAHGGAYQASHEVLAGTREPAAALRPAPFTNIWKNHRKESQSRRWRNVVLMLNFGPRILMANVIKTALMMKYDHWIGNPVE